MDNNSPAKLSFKGLYENELKNIFIAYEPIWSVGTGVLPSIKEIENAIEIIREIIKNEFSEKASKCIKIIYGGSINSQNAKNFLSINYNNPTHQRNQRLQLNPLEPFCHTSNNKKT